MHLTGTLLISIYIIFYLPALWKLQAYSCPRAFGSVSTAWNVLSTDLACNTYSLLALRSSVDPSLTTLTKALPLPHSIWTSSCSLLYVYHIDYYLTLSCLLFAPRILSASHFPPPLKCKSYETRGLCYSSWSSTCLTGRCSGNMCWVNGGKIEESEGQKKKSWERGRRCRDVTSLTRHGADVFLFSLML